MQFLTGISTPHKVGRFIVPHIRICFQSNQIRSVTMATLRYYAVLLAILILISGPILTRPAETRNAFPLRTPSHYSTGAPYHAGPLITCPPPPFEC